MWDFETDVDHLSEVNRATRFLRQQTKSFQQIMRQLLDTPDPVTHQL